MKKRYRGNYKKLGKIPMSDFKKRKLLLKNIFLLPDDIKESYLFDNNRTYTISFTIYISE